MKKEQQQKGEFNIYKSSGFLPDLNKIEFIHGDGNCKYFLFSNDLLHCKSLFDNYDKLYNRKIDSYNDKIAIIVGAGNIYSLLDKIPEKYVVVIDNHPEVIKFLKFEDDVIKNKKTNYKQKVDEFDKVSQNKPTNDMDLSNYKKLLGDRFYLYSSKRLETIKKILSEKKVIHLQMDFLNMENIKKLAKTLNQYKIKISFLNLTNLQSYDYEKKLEQVLKYMPLNNIFTAFNTRFTSSNLISKHVGYQFVSTNIDELIKNIGKAREESDPYRFRNILPMLYKLRNKFNNK